MPTLETVEVKPDPVAELIARASSESAEVREAAGVYERALVRMGFLPVAPEVRVFGATGVNDYVR